MLFSLLIIPLIVGVYLRLQGGDRSQPSSDQLATAGDEAGARISPSPAPAVVSDGSGDHPRRPARPQAQISLPRVEGTVMLVFDVSASMGATDAAPSRLEAAKAAGSSCSASLRRCRLGSCRSAVAVSPSSRPPTTRTPCSHHLAWSRPAAPRWARASCLRCTRLRWTPDSGHCRTPAGGRRFLPRALTERTPSLLHLRPCTINCRGHLPALGHRTAVGW